MKVLLSVVLFSLLTSACSKQRNMPEIDQPNPSTIPPSGQSRTYLALGDSYTIGESVKQSESFPFQLQSMLKNNGINVASPKIIATTGWTTSELQSAIVQAKLTQKFDIVTLLIGVNNQYRGNSIETYKKEFAELLQTAISFANGDKTKVFVVSIPDWGVTPFGKNAGKSPQVIASEIDSFNAINEQITISADISYTNITPASRKASSDLSLIANDGLHPSAKMYSEWANALNPKVSAVLK
ncbi:SGNH/GDSL hydrolase family protein [Pedobacter sp. MC2016-05]|uniref:SGNH/GDSL hydrolase family protein n=1 Tax=Pedobacter sp. MC2016-05 TaxID=2994474 RepID=UPI002247AD12|nr:SGNH/GDSL hydrolase family protein [Pedobacter sp. MC2016-05]MCX2476342.1 SGNH/GDSL hydrolase family protein [Pedobacter sp. MC2016-05]